MVQGPRSSAQDNEPADQAFGCGGAKANSTPWADRRLCPHRCLAIGTFAENHRRPPSVQVFCGPSSRQSDPHCIKQVATCQTPAVRTLSLQETSLVRLNAPAFVGR